ncbi:hypothetical protein FA743_03325 [Paracoccus gahaiensis]|uniref:Uncharacterized protein n=1 Tax=Paracoccus gahaiensis TaxID=1706839 RepID=A0A4U0RF80_9RHOB|nr:hypothetical protein [Paracoccus gahaiensis]TJZ93270.1 hypothetical protein FA743_03325 [Paracoccus gahaiensis]
MTPAPAESHGIVSGPVRRMLAIVAVLALVLMSAWLPSRPMALPGSLLPSHDQLSDTALLTGLAVLERPAAPSLPKSAAPDFGDSRAVPGGGVPRAAHPVQSSATAPLSGTPRPATQSRAPPTPAG